MAVDLYDIYPGQGMRAIQEALDAVSKQIAARTQIELDREAEVTWRVEFDEGWNWIVNQTSRPLQITKLSGDNISPDFDGFLLQGKERVGLKLENERSPLGVVEVEWDHYGTVGVWTSGYIKSKLEV
ncbi:hypothetical protein LG293_17535 (plasmid) [Citricoccus nitrophenolicus]